MTAAARSWQGVWALGGSWLTYAGPLGPTAPHSHHAAQLIGCPAGEVTANVQGTSAVGPAVAIPSNVRHQILGATSDGWIVFVEPNSRLGKSVAASAGVITVQHPSPPSGSTFTDYEAFAFSAVASTVADEVGPQSAAVHWATERALEQIPRLLTEGRVSAAEIARQVGLSASRLSHVFNADTGTTLPAYLRWVRLRLAVESVARGHSLTRAAHTSGFADGAHLARSFRAMFGLAPSQVVASGEWLVG